MRHIFFIDQLEKLNVKKDSTLMMALTFQQAGLETYFLYENDFYVTNEIDKNELLVHRFDASFQDDGFYLKSCTTTAEERVIIDPDTVIHMRLDPPFDTRYQRSLWMLDFLSQKTGCKVVNNPNGIMKYNEKLTGFAAPGAIDSFVGASPSGFTLFVDGLKQKGVKELIIKPLDLYSGIGVEKFSLTGSDLTDVFKEAVSLYKGAVVAQPFMEKVYSGELRSIYLQGQEIGTIIKTPPKGNFLANIAQGAKFEKITLTDEVAKNCKSIADKLLVDGVDLVAFDILGEAINEVNITCPGLMVEVSYALEKNLCLSYLKLFT